jgi:hypothetical protein
MKIGEVNRMAGPWSVKKVLGAKEQLRNKPKVV